MRMPTVINYFVPAWRAMLRDRMGTLIKVGSLTVGLAAALFVLLFVEHELSHDRWMPNADQIYRYEHSIVSPDGSRWHMPYSPVPALDVLSDRFPAVTGGTRMSTNIHSIHFQGEVHYELVSFADPNFLQLLELPLLSGDRSTVLRDPSSIVISRAMGLKYFGSQDAVGQTVTIEAGNGGEKRDFRVTGVFEDIPSNSHLVLDFLASNPGNDAEFGFDEATLWDNIPVYTYLQLDATADPDAMRADFPAMLDQHAGDIDPMGGRKATEVYFPRLEPLTSLHMNHENRDPMKPTGNWLMTWSLLGVGLVLLLIACINYTNLAMAASLDRQREVSMRKVHGASRLQLVTQHLLETLVLTLASVLMACIVVSLLQPWVNALVDKPMHLGQLLHLKWLLPAVVLVVAVTLLAGLYPAFKLSGVQPAAAFRGLSGTGRPAGARFRGLLVMLQFGACVTLAIAALVIHLQRQYVADYDLGFHAGDKLVIRWMNWGHFAAQSDSIKEQIERLPQVLGTTYSNVVPGDPMPTYLPMRVPGVTTTENVTGQGINVDTNFFDIYDVPLLAGRVFSLDYGTDNSTLSEPDDSGVREFPVILNATAWKALGFPSPADAIGQVIDVNNPEIRPRIVGVVDDMHFQSLRDQVAPVTYYLASDQFGNLTVRYQAGTDLGRLVEDIDNIWRQFIPDDPITLEYLDENLRTLYIEDRRGAQMMSSLALLALLVACLGLYGMSALAAAQQRREVSIRKVHGASVGGLVLLMLWRLALPVALAIGLAWPLGWLLSVRYLEQFSYRMELGPGLFVLCAIGALVVGCLTVGGQALKVARTAPALALRYRG